MIRNCNVWVYIEVFQFILKIQFHLILTLNIQEMLSDQQKAEKEKLASEQLQKELAQSLVEIGKKRTEVEKDLAQVISRFID